MFEITHYDKIPSNKGRDIMTQIEHIEPLFLTTADIEKMKKKKLELGRGTDGIVFRTGKFKTRNRLYKIYHNHSTSYDCLYQTVYDDEGVNIADNRRYFRMTNASRFKTNYYNKDGVRIYGIDAVYKAIERQENIHLTHLQKRPIMVDDHFRGTVLHYHRHHIPIYNMHIFPLSLQLDIFKQLILAVEELIDNNIYHIDLSLKPETDYREANVLISIKRHPAPAIIDVDGKSAIYTEEPNKEYKTLSLKTLKSLITNILFEINYQEIEELDFDYIESKLRDIGINFDIISQILDIDKLIDIDELSNFLDDYALIKKVKHTIY